jgi:hypothetical protein
VSSLSLSEILELYQKDKEDDGKLTPRGKEAGELLTDICRYGNLEENLYVAEHDSGIPGHNAIVGIQRISETMSESEIVDFLFLNEDLSFDVLLGFYATSEPYSEVQDVLFYYFGNKLPELSFYNLLRANVEGGKPEYYELVDTYRQLAVDNMSTEELEAIDDWDDQYYAAARKFIERTIFERKWHG